MMIQNKKQQQQIQNKLWQGFVIFLLCFLGSVTVNAEEVPISLNPVLPENQLTKEAGFYDLLMKPGQNQEIALEISNSGDKPVTLNVEINPAMTGDNGVIDYTRTAKDKDDSMKIPLSDVAKTDAVVSIQGKQKISLPIKLTMPTDPFAGRILGAVRVTQAEAESKEKEKNSISITNKFAYVIAIQLREDEKALKEELTLQSIRASQVAGRNTLKAQLQNPTATLIDKVSYSGVVTEKGKNEILHENKVDDYRVAPNTTFNFPISWGNQAYKAGTYTLKLNAESKQSGEKWSFTQDFKISEEEAKELNEKAVGLEAETPWLMYIFIGISCLILLLLLFFGIIFWQRQKRKKAELARLARKKKKRKKRPSQIPAKEKRKGKK